MDSLPLVKTLQDSGIKPEQAEAIASGTKQFVEDSMSDYATKSDLEVFGLRLTTDIISTVDDKITAAKQELKGDITEAKQELKGDITEVKQELKGDVAAVNNRLDRLFMFVLMVGMGVVGAIYLLLRDAGVT